MEPMTPDTIPGANGSTLLELVHTASTLDGAIPWT